MLVRALTSVVLVAASATLHAAPREELRAIPKGDRRLSMSVTLPSDGDYEAALDTARSVGVDATSLSVHWDDIEVAPGVFAPATNWLAIANAYYPGQGMGVELVISTYDTNVLRVPADLSSTPFDHPTMIARFEALLDWTFAQVPDLDVLALSIGNEIDIYLGADATAWSAYRTFFAATAAHARALRPGMPVGAKATFQGLTGSPAAELFALNQTADMVLATYYPFAADGTLRPSTVVRGDFAALLGLYPARLVAFSECGYPSSRLLGSSRALQARFVREAFLAWDDHADRVPWIELTWMHDLSAADVADLQAYYGVQDPLFAAFLATLGLRTEAGAGSDKAAFRTLRDEARLRGW